MIAFEDALKISLDAVFRKEPERVDLSGAHGRILAEDIISDVDMPPFDKSSVDGFACRRADMGEELEITEIIPAGKYPEHPVTPGKCAKIMTGAPVPKGADCVVMVEFSKQTADRRVRFTISETAPNIAYEGEDVRAGTKLISAGVCINPGHIAVMASAGYARPLVSCRPSVAVISTGDELVEPGEKPSGSNIRNSNAYQLIAQAGRMGISATYLGIAKDDEAVTLDFLTRSLAGHDVVLLTGGVSMGDYDHVPAMMKKAGLQVLFEKIAIQPGRPTVLARGEKKLCFGLPGNPVSSYVLFELLAKPVLYAMMGHTYSSPVIRMPLGRNYKRQRSDRLNVVPVQLAGDHTAIPVAYHGSAHIHAMVFAGGFLFVPPGITEITEGTIVDVRPV